MPISWLSDISEHIKTLKEMNDFQTDEVFQIFNMLHLRGQRHEQTNDESNSSDTEGAGTSDRRQYGRSTLAEDANAFLAQQQSN